MKILGISGSLRKGSFNTALLRAFKSLSPKEVDFEIYIPDKLPLFNQDLEASLPKPVIEFKNKIEEADAILFACPEHNHAITASLKNAIEWGSRPSGQSSWGGKLMAIVGASNGIISTARAQMQLREVIFSLGGNLVRGREFLVPKGHDKIDENGEIVDEYTLEKVKKLLGTLYKINNTS